MPTIASGGNATISVGLDDILTVECRSGWAQYENPVGTKVEEFSGVKSFGPFAAAGSVKLTSVTGAIYYEVSDLAAPSLMIGAFKWASLPSAALNSGARARVADVGIAPGMLVVSDGARWIPDGPQIISRSAVAASVTGTTNETTLATVTIPAGAMGLNGGVLIYTTWGTTNSANNKTLRTRHGGIGGTAYGTVTVTTSASIADARKVRNRGAANSQVGGSSATGSLIGGASGSVAVTASLDTTVAQDIAITGQLALGTETATLESYEVWLLP